MISTKECVNLFSGDNSGPFDIKCDHVLYGMGLRLVFVSAYQWVRGCESSAKFSFTHCAQIWA